MFDYEGKLILITGASTGLGLCLAREYYKKGAYLALVARSEDKLNKMASSMDSGGARVKIFPADLIQLEKIPQLLLRIREECERSVDVLVHNAGMSCYGEIEDCPFEVVDQIITLNYLTGVRLVQLLVSSMKEKRNGQVIWINSGSAIRGIPFAAAYSASKAAARAFCESIRGEIKNYQIDVLSVIPGALDTNFHENQKNFSKRQKLRRTGTPQSPSVLARSILRAGQHRKKELIFGRNVRIGRHLAYWNPGLLDFLYQWRLKEEGER